MAFQGSLRELPLPDIIQLVSVSGKTGKFTLTREDDEGEIFLRNGQIVHARSGDATGEEAIYALAIWSEGEFTFAPGEEGTEQTITRSNTNLLMEAARRLDEWKVLSKKIPSVDMVPELVASSTRHEVVTLNPQEWMLVTKIDGRRTIADIASDLGSSAFDIAKQLYGILGAELAVLKEKKIAAPRAVPPAADPAELEALVGLAEGIRRIAEKHIGAAGAKTIEKQYATALDAIRGGSGPAAIRDMIRELEKTTALLRGSPVAEKLRSDIAEHLRTAS
ncbi:MAG: DUF4388 domain-containing protein [Thermoanaerobaculia bacterium]